MRLALGTVQLGLDYGVANEAGKPSVESALSILDAALRMGICDYDTASAYGVAETILGQWHPSDSVRIVSKFSGNPVNESILTTMDRSLRESLLRMSRQRIYGYLLHDANQVENSSWLEALATLKANGLLERTGVSIYTPEQALLAARSPFVDIIQIPYSLMDQRLDECGFFTIARAEGKEIWARSAFVQGLLFMDAAKVPNHLQGILPLRERALMIGARYGFKLQELAILFSLGNLAIDRVLIGVDTVSQLLEYQGIEEKLDDYSECRAELVKALRGQVDPYLVSPHKWVKK